MPLTLTVLRCPDAIPPETRTIAGGDFAVGRGPGVDWILPDPERLLSKRHFAIAYRGGSWQIADTSTNGTTMNRDPAPIGTGAVRTLRDGDRITLGAYEIEVRLAAEAAQGIGMDGGFGRQPAGRGASPFADPFGLDPMAPPPQARHPFDEPPDSFGFASHGAQLPHEFDPLAPDPNAAPFLGPTQEDHRSVMDDAFQPQAAIGQQSFNTGGKLPGDDLLPDDWDNDLLSGITPPSALAPAPSAPPAAPPSLPPRPAAQPAVQPPVQRAPPAPQMAPPMARPMAPQMAPPMARTIAVPEPDPFAVPEPDPFAEPEAPPPRRPDAPATTPAAAFTPTPFDEPFDLQPQPEPQMTPPAAAAAPDARGPAPPQSAARSAAQAQSAAQPQSAAQARAPALPQAPAADDDDLLAAFLEGAAMTDMRPADPPLAMRRLGAAFRTLVSGLRAVLIARASIKSEFRIEQTMIRARGNNPLKFSAGDDDALAALLGTGRRTDMSAAEAVADALKDIRRHELASMAAMQTAVRALLAGLDPTTLRAQAEQGGGLSLLASQKKARAWDAYEALHTRTVQALADDFDSVFGKAFARAYEQAMDDIAAEEP